MKLRLLNNIWIEAEGEDAKALASKYSLAITKRGETLVCFFPIWDRKIIDSLKAEGVELPFDD